MPDPTRALPDPDLPPPPREWLLTNGLGGYASGTVVGRLARRYHGLLVSAHAAPLGRVLSLVALDAVVERPNAEPVHLGTRLDPRSASASEQARLHAFELDDGLPVWTWEIGERRIRRRLVMPHGSNTISVEYALLSGASLDLVVRPLLQPRGHDDPVDRTRCDPRVRTRDCGTDVECEGLPDLRLRFPPDMLHVEDPRTVEDVRYPLEDQRGYPSTGTLWSPGTLGARLEPGTPLTIVASTEPDERVPDPDHQAMHAEELERRRHLADRADATGDPLRTRLVLAADSFLFTPVSRGSGHGAKSVIAGYHWFTDWGRDTMISLEGLTLDTGRGDEAAAILRTFAGHIRDGLIPNLFPEGDDEGLYHTADATLWFFHAVHRYVERTGDDELLNDLLPALRGIVDHHIRGTRFGIAVDPGDDLLRQGQEGYQLTWMDAKVDDWVVTPRRGKAVEINALWYNALRLLAGWLRGVDPDQADALERRAERTRRSFNSRFWIEDAGYLYDTLDPDDDAFRPNQLFAIALDHPVLDEAHWEPVVDSVADRLLTPVGLRSLAPGHPQYEPRYTGDLRARDAAYHQGTVWGWLIGPFVDAWLRVHPGGAGARRHLEGLIAHLDEAGVGSMSEIFDAEPPFTPRGCVAQAWTVAEVLRALDRTTTEGSTA